jgi:hypothetical protein
MTQKKSLTEQIQKPLLTKQMLIGAGIGLIVILFFIVPVREPNPEWPKFWMIRPLIIVPLAGATAGAFYYFLVHLLFRTGWKKMVGIVLSVLVYFIGLWMGIVLGLDGTLWN